jgi:hypothetical protein
VAKLDNISKKQIKAITKPRNKTKKRSKKPAIKKENIKVSNKVVPKVAKQESKTKVKNVKVNQAPKTAKKKHVKDINIKKVPKKTKVTKKHKKEVKDVEVKKIVKKPKITKEKKIVRKEPKQKTNFFMMTPAEVWSSVKNLFKTIKIPENKLKEDIDKSELETKDSSENLFDKTFITDSLKLKNKTLFIILFVIIGLIIGYLPFIGYKNKDGVKKDNVEGCSYTEWKEEEISYCIVNTDGTYYTSEYMKYEPVPNSERCIRYTRRKRCD